MTQQVLPTLDTERDTHPDSIGARPCQDCGAMVMDFNQWFTEMCEARDPGGHIVKDWECLPHYPDYFPRQVGAMSRGGEVES